MHVHIVGAGASGLFCAYQLVKKNIKVSLYEKESSVGKKLLIAGKSGLNITTAYPIEDLHTKYFKHAQRFKEYFDFFSPEDTKLWLKELGFETFEGSSFKVFPKEFKAAALIKRVKDFLIESGKCDIFTKHSLIDFSKDELAFTTGKVPYEKAIFAFGGASWSSSGSDGKWIKLFKDKDIEVDPFLASNCGFKTKYKAHKRIPLKNINMQFLTHSLKGESLLTEDGIEGGVLYHLSSYIRDQLRQGKKTSIKIDFLPNIENKSLIDKMKNLGTKDSYSKRLKKVIRLDKDVFDFVKETLSKEDYFDFSKLVNALKSFELEIQDINDIDQAISTMGGVSFMELDEALSLKKYPNIHISGEMISWEAPTGGFLLQGCFSMSAWIINIIKKGQPKADP